MFITISYLSPFKRIIILGERTDAPQLLRMREKPQPPNTREEMGKREKVQEKKGEPSTFLGLSSKKW